MAAQTLDDLQKGDDGGHGGPEAQKPFWDLKHDPKGEGYAEAKVHEWLKKEFEYLTKANEERINGICKNLELYKGMQYEQNAARSPRRDTEEKRKPDKIVVNLLADNVKKKVARLLKHKPAVQVMPTDDEQQDKIAAKAAKKTLGHIWYVNDYEGSVEPKMHRYAKVMGEAFVWLDWDSERGDLHPGYKKLKEDAKGEPVKVPLQDASGKAVLDEQGKPKSLSGEVRQGEVRYRVITPFTCLLQRMGINALEDVEYCFIIERMPLQRAKRRFPNKANELKKSDVKAYDFEKMEWVTLPNHVEIVHFYHRRQIEIPNGAWATFTTDALCSNKNYPFNMENLGVGQTTLPIERLTDEDECEELHGKSHFKNTAGLASVYNGLTNMILTNIRMCSLPKWMTPKNSVEITDLGNSRTVVQYKGPNPPVLAQSNPTPGEVFKFRQETKEEVREMAGLGQISRGEPPPGITAGIALQYLGEQEQDDKNEEAVKAASFRRHLAFKSLAIAAEMYDEDDERTLWAAGRDGQWLKERADVKALASSYTITIEDASALPDSRAARTQAIFDLRKEFPGKLDDEQTLDLLGFSQSDKFISMITVSVRTAEAENEDILDGKEVDEPQEFEHHVIHWKSHSRKLLEPSFRMMKPEIQAAMKAHVMATEMLMHEKSLLNPAFAAMVTPLELYPMLFMPAAPTTTEALLPNPEMSSGSEQQAPLDAMSDQVAVDQPLPVLPPDEAPEAQLPSVQ